MTKTEVRKVYDTCSSTSNYGSCNCLAWHDPKVSPHSNGTVQDKQYQKDQHEQQQKQLPQHRQQSTSDLFHDAKEALTTELNHEWDPKLNYETIFDERMAPSPPMKGPKMHPSTTRNVVWPKTQNIFLTVDIKEKDTTRLRSNDTGGVPSDNIVLQASALDSRSSWLKTRTRRGDEIQYGTSGVPYICSQDNNRERFPSHPASNNNNININSVEGSAGENYYTNNTIHQTTPITKDLTNLSPISSRASVSSPTKSILRTRTRTNIQQPQPQTKFVSFASILHTEYTISVSPECLRRSVRRKTAATYDTPISQRNIHSPSEECKDEMNESSSSSEKMTRVLVLLMDPGSKQYALTSIHFPSPKPDDCSASWMAENERSQLPPPVQLGSLLKLIRKTTTHRPLKIQRYRGFCRPNDGREMINTLTIQDNAVREDEILIAIPKGYAASECAELAQPILRDVTFNTLVEKLRKKKRTRQRKTAIMAEVQKIERESALSGGWGVGDWSGRWGIKWLLLVPVLLLVWTFASMGLQRDGHLYHFDDLGLIKLVNALVDDIDTGISRHASF